MGDKEDNACAHQGEEYNDDDAVDGRLWVRLHRICPCVWC